MEWRRRIAIIDTGTHGRPRAIKEASRGAQTAIVVKVNDLKARILFGFVAGAITAGIAFGQEPDNTNAVPVLTAVETLAACTASLPRERLLLNGTLSVRRQRGIVEAEHPFRLDLNWGAIPATAICSLYAPGSTTTVERVVMQRRDGRSQIALYSGPGLALQPAPSLASRVRGTDMTWLDLTLDFLWWPEARFDGTGSVLGRACDILVVTPPMPVSGCSAVRLWVDRRLHFLMQAEQLDPQGSPIRRMWVQRVRKINERWMIRDMEIETVGGSHRTRLYVDDLEAP